MFPFVLDFSGLLKNKYYRGMWNVLNGTTLLRRLATKIKTSKKVTDNVNQSHFLHPHLVPQPNIMTWRHIRRALSSSSRFEQVCYWKYAAHFYHGVLGQIEIESLPSIRPRTRLVLASKGIDFSSVFTRNLIVTKKVRWCGLLFLVFAHVTFALTTVAIRHVGAQTNSLNREITVRTKA